jgi:hypothetical protein
VKLLRVLYKILKLMFQSEKTKNKPRFTTVESGELMGTWSWPGDAHHIEFPCGPVAPTQTVATEESFQKTVLKI